MGPQQPKPFFIVFLVAVVATDPPDQQTNEGKRKNTFVFLFWAFGGEVWQKKRQEKQKKRTNSQILLCFAFFLSVSFSSIIMFLVSSFSLF